MIHTLWRVSTIVCIWNCAHMHKAWKRCRLWPHNGKKEKKKAIHGCSHVPQCPRTHPHICMYDSWEIYHSQGKKKRKNELWHGGHAQSGWLTFSISPPPHTHSSAKLRCSTLQWLNFAFYRRRFAAWEMKTNMTNDTLCSSTLSSLYSAGICSSFAARDRW